MARKVLRRLKGIVKSRGGVEEGYTVKKQGSSALNHIHFWSDIQAEIRARRLNMVIDGRMRQKKLKTQLKLEAKFNELEVDWGGGPETMEEIRNRIQQREDAAAKREGTMAYAFSHQWRANSGQCFGQAYYDIGKESWGWSWIAVRPWEDRVQAKLPKTKHTRSRSTNSPFTKPVLSSMKCPRKLSSLP